MSPSKEYLKREQINIINFKSTWFIFSGVKFSYRILKSL